MHEIKELVLLYVFVLLQKTIYIVDHIPGIVFDPELHFPTPSVVTANVIDVRIKF